MAFDGVAARDKFAALRQAKVTVFPNQVRVYKEHAGQSISLKNGRGRCEMIHRPVIECDEKTTSLVVRTGIVQNSRRGIAAPNVFCTLKLLVEFSGRNIKKKRRRTLHDPVVCQDQDHADTDDAIEVLVIWT